MTCPNFPHPKGFSIVQLVLLLTAVVVAATFNIIFVMREQAAVRDAIRIADMARLEAAFAMLSFETASYAEAAKGCPNVGDLVSTCTLGKYLPTITSLKDPGRHRYTISEVPTDSRFRVQFTLERGVGTYKKGVHALTQDGIQ